jgi:crossover junction endodeoxyribonuclease RuvC
MGYGVVESGGSEITPLDYGTITCLRSSPPEKRLGQLYHRLCQIIVQYQPDVVAIEQPFVARNIKSALAIGRAQAVTILAAVNNSVPTREYTPAQVKRQVANYGASSKEQIQQMVMLELGLGQVPEPNDAADALAVAICHLRETHLDKLLSSSQEAS